MEIHEEIEKKKPKSLCLLYFSGKWPFTEGYRPLTGPVIQKEWPCRTDAAAEPTEIASESLPGRNPLYQISPATRGSHRDMAGM